MKIIVIGAGPIGSLLSLHLTEKNYEVVVLEEHKAPGLPRHCAGVISYETLRLYGFNTSSSIVLNKLNGAYIVFPGGKILHVYREGHVAYVVDRAKFDEKLATYSEEKGTVFFYSTEAKKLHFPGSKIVVETNRENFSCDKVFVCEGLSRRITRQLTEVRQKPLIGLNVDAEACFSFPKDHVYVFFSKKISDRLFGWIIPLGNNLVRIGTASTANTDKYLEALINKACSAGILDKVKILEKTGGLINVDGPLKHFVFLKDRAVLVGDSAGQTKPTTGGGLYYGGLGAIIAAKSPTGFIYEKKWWQKCGKDIKSMLFLRRVLDSLDDRDLEKIIKRVNLEELSALLSSKGMFDTQSKTVIELVKYFLKKPLAVIHVLTTLAKSLLF